MKVLHLLRHAKSDWSDACRSDHDRPLNERGRRARRDVARLVASWPIDLVVCSTARRARATAKPVVAALECPVEFEDALYMAGAADDVLSVVTSLPGDAEAVMLVGHNPWIEEFTALLCGWSPRYPTAALGSIVLDVEHWLDVAPGAARLVAHVVPSQLRCR